MEIFPQNIEQNKNEEKIVNKSDNNLLSIENEAAGGNDVPKLIKPIDLW